MIISGFAGIGKSTYAASHPDLAIDLESSNFKWIFDESVKNMNVEERKGLADKIPNPEYPANYIKAIKDANKKYKYVFISMDMDVRKKLKDYIVMFPGLECKCEYIERYKTRNNGQNFIELLSDKYDEWINALMDVPQKKIVLGVGEFASDGIKKYEFDIFKESARVKMERDLEFIPEPTYTYSKGDKVSIGHLKNPVIVDHTPDKRMYIVEYTQEERGKQPYQKFWYYDWTTIRPEPAKDTESLVDTDSRDLKLRYSQSSLNGLLNMTYSFGVDDKPSYQRDYVWEQSDKEALIDSIFHSVDIGKFAFVHLGYDGKYGYEVLDGKQRLKALLDFYENRFPYKGKYYNDLCLSDRLFFRNYPISYCELEDCSEKQKLRAFIMLNTAGKRLDTAQIDKAKELYEKETNTAFK